MSERRRALEEALRYHEFVAGLDAELQWIADHMPAASSEGTSVDPYKHMVKNSLTQRNLIDLSVIE